MLCKKEKGQCWKQDLDSCLKCCGLRLTQPRKILFQYLETVSEFMSAEEIFHNIQGDTKGMGLATIYRTLSLLSELGYIEKLETGEKTFFRLLHQDKAHKLSVHIICEDCKRIITTYELEEEEHACLMKFHKRIENQSEFAISRKTVQFWGICKDCQ